MLKKIFSHCLKQKFIRFSISGSIATLVDIALLYLLTEYIGWWYLISATFSFSLGSLTHFTVSRHWVFKNLEKTFWRQYQKFFIVHIIGFIINLTGLFILVEYFNIYYILAKIVVVILGVLWTFWGHGKFTFKQNAQKQSNKIK